MKKISHSLFMTVLALSSVASANTQNIGTFSAMRDACNSPAKYHNQIAPTNIQVSCKDVRTRWIPDTGTSHSLDNSRQISVQVNSDKYTSNAEIQGIASDAQLVSCPALKQVVETVETVRAATCEDMLRFEGTAAEFCAAVVTSMLEQNPDAVSVRETGRIFNMCPAASEASPAQQQVQQQAPQQAQQPAAQQAQQAHQQAQPAQQHATTGHHFFNH